MALLPLVLITYADDDSLYMGKAVALIRTIFPLHTRHLSVLTTPQLR